MEDDQLITCDGIGNAKERSPVHQEVPLVVDGDCTTLNNGFAALKSILPACMPGKGITHSFNILKKPIRSTLRTPYLQNCITKQLSCRTQSDIYSI
jgi:hypothetical protein